MIRRRLEHGRLYSLSLLLAATACLIAVMILNNRAHTSTGGSMPVLRGEEAVGYLKEQGTYSSLGEAMAAARYGIYRTEHTHSEELSGPFYANNPAQRMTAFFTREGIRLESKSAGDRKWRMGMKLSGLGYGERLLQVASGEMRVNGNRFEIDKRVNSRDSGLTEWYVNRAEGIEQGFILTSPPGERRHGQLLRLRLEVEGDLNATVGVEGQAIDLIGREGDKRLRYDHLRVYDATGRELNAAMSVENGDVWLEVEDGKAVYPMSIDPEFSQLQQLTAPDGADGDAFGSSVAISGGTVVVGAEGEPGQPTFGSAYVFVRAGANWSLQKKLSATDGATFDKFGGSVAISGETIVVGAEGDNSDAFSDQGSAYVFVRAGTVWSQQQKLTASDGAADDFFGASVAISGETIVVGAFSDNVGANTAQGSAYVFVRTGTTWSEQQKLTASDGAPNDAFGNSVAIDGETVVVGARSATVGANSNQGAAYAFVRAGAAWSEQQKLTPSNGGGVIGFGSSVGISGETVVVGAPADFGVGALQQGSAFVFVRAGSVWSQQKKLIASDGAVGDEFGGSVAISGETLVVGAAFDDVGANSNQGSAYVFVRTGSVWSQEEKLLASDGAFIDQFGTSVAISGETVVVSAPFDDVGTNENQGSAYVFDCAGTQQWEEQAMTVASDGAANDSFGFSVAISGETAVVGALFDNVGANVDQGSAYVFLRAGTVWSQQQKLTAPDGATGDLFGRSVAISGETIVVGAFSNDVGANTDQGSAYVFVRTGAVWGQQQTLTASDGAANDGFGFSVAISGETIVAGAGRDNVGSNANQGSAYVFVRTGAAWSEQQKLTASDGAANDLFGSSVAISRETIVVGADQDEVGTNVLQGSAYVFLRTGTAWSEQQKLIASNGSARDQFGFSVAISGESIAVGTFHPDAMINVQRGSAYVFVRTGAVWSQQQILTASDGSGGDDFGQSVAIDGKTIVVGAEGDDVGANGDQGSAYVFVRTGAVWNELQKLTASDGAVGDAFGQSVAISGETIVVGSPLHNIGANSNQGSAYVFLAECIPSTPPTITTSSVIVQQGHSVTGAGIATVSDNEDAASTLAVSVISGGTATGVTLTNISNTSGAVTANVAASCNATDGTVRLRVTDSAGLTGEADLQVNVTGNDPPVITCPANVNLLNSAAGQCSAILIFFPPASDDCDGSLTPTCLPASGSSFNVGTTTVTCTVTDSSGNTAQCSFTVMVNDSQSPTVTCPANIITPTASGQCSAVVTYATATATDNCPGIGSPVCTPPSGSSFLKGVTTVTCTATDAAGLTGSCTFTVTVNDTQPPAITCPASIVGITPSPNANCLVVNYPAPVVSDNCPGVTTVCNPPSGTCFPLGTTTVTCTATDSAGNSTQCGFTVTTFDFCLQDDSNPGTALSFNSQTGDYRFCTGGVSFTGKGTVSKQGLTVTLTHNPSDRRVQARVDGAANRATASLQSPPGVTKCTITDRNLNNNTCLCQ